MLPLDSSTVLGLLAETPRRIAELSNGRSDEQLRRKPSAGCWSANEVLAHLRACADVWGSGIDRMLKQDHPVLRYVSPRAWIRKTNYVDQGFAASLGAFASQRKQLLTVLQALPEAGWLRGAKVKADASSKFREESVLSYAQRMAQHEAGHLDQIARILSAK
jgi:hypothetical protein